MLKHISALAVFAAVPLVITGCGSSDGSQLTKANTLGQGVKFSDNSADVTTLPFYFEGTRTFSAFDTTSATATPLKLTTTPPPATIKSTNLLEKVSLQMMGEVVGATATLPSFYKLTITYFNANDIVNTASLPVTNPNGQILGGSSAATAIVYTVGVARDINNDLYSFAPDADGPVIRTTSSALPVWVWAANAAGQVTSGSNPILDFTVNVPTASGTTLAPYTATTNTASQSLGTLVTDSATAATGGRNPSFVNSAVQTVASLPVLTQYLGNSGTSGAIPFASGVQAYNNGYNMRWNVAIPWVAQVTAVGSAAATDPIGYWKTGFGLVESVVRYNWYKGTHTVLAGPTVTTFVNNTAPAGTVPAATTAQANYPAPIASLVANYDVNSLLLPTLVQPVNIAVPTATLTYEYLTGAPFEAGFLQTGFVKLPRSSN